MYSKTRSFVVGDLDLKVFSESDHIRADEFEGDIRIVDVINTMLLTRTVPESAEN